MKRKIEMQLVNESFLVCTRLHSGLIQSGEEGLLVSVGFWRRVLWRSPTPQWKVLACPVLDVGLEPDRACSESLKRCREIGTGGVAADGDFADPKDLG
ncbi:MAG TPA: hypothetical protein VKB70_04065, partial [Gaiellaceae bacterium]|nr:hypothetical protein [Gaiellaceae bacterium]